MGTNIVLLMVLCLLLAMATMPTSSPVEEEEAEEKVIKVEGGPESVIWVVQLSDLHFSVHHPDRALDFKNIVGPALRIINPSLILITGDLTDGKSEDLLIMKQNQDEWVEYHNIMEDVVGQSGLDKSIFYDLRGNHDNFGVPVVGGSFDYFSKYSINGQLGRKENVNSVTVETNELKHLFVGVDSTTSSGLRGPTNLFGHPTDQLLNQVDSQLSQWDSQIEKPVTKIAFGHFPLSFSGSSESQKTLRDVFLKHSLSAYLCGHLHTRFGKNLKRHHQSSKKILSSHKLFQFNIHQVTPVITKNCSFGVQPDEEFWEWEMGDWRKGRSMRILAIDRGHTSYVDIDFKSGAKRTIVLPTFPLDSRFMSTFSLHQKYECQLMVPLSFETVRALVFSVSPIVSVMARIYDSRPGTLDVVMETPMMKLAGSRGAMYAAPWNYKAFEDPSPDRFLLQIETIDIMGRSTFSELRPFSINGLSAKVSWTWKEFFVMGCQWATLYYPILWSSIYLMLSSLLIPKILFYLSKKQYSYRSFIADKGIISLVTWVLQELCRVPVVWFGILTYLIYLISCPWFSGQVFTDGGIQGYMTYLGWVVKTSKKGKHEYIGFPDIMVVVLPHLLFVVLPTILVAGALAAERDVYREHVLSLSGKKEDDYGKRKKEAPASDQQVGRRSKFNVGGRWMRNVLLTVCLAICWRHFKNCRALIKAYEMNPLLHFPVYSFAIPLLLVYTVYKTGRLKEGCIK